MSKEGNNNKININKELKRKHLFDSIIFVAGLLVISGFAWWVNAADTPKLLSVILAVLVVGLILFSYSKNEVKKTLNKIVSQTIETTIGEVNSMQLSNSKQKEKNSI